MHRLFAALIGWNQFRKLDFKNCTSAYLVISVQYRALDFVERLEAFHVRDWLLKHDDPISG